MKLLVLDNYDSFTYNLVHLVRELGCKLDVFRNNEIQLDEVNGYDKILLSPGPGLPDEAGVMKDIIRQYGPSKSILGVCLGHQGIAEVYGAHLYNIPEVLHGVTSSIRVLAKGDRIFKGMPETFRITHYHSWAVVRGTIRSPLEVTALNDSGMVMAIKHKSYDVRGVQFHPESILTEHGMTLIKNWLNK